MTNNGWQKSKDWATQTQLKTMLEEGGCKHSPWLQKIFKKWRGI